MNQKMYKDFIKIVNSLIITEIRKPFKDREHDWSEVLISHKKKKLTRGQIRAYYRKNINNLFKHLKDKEIMITLAIAKNDFVLKRMHKNDYIKITDKKGIDNPNSLEYWIERRAVEFFVTANKTTDVAWVDVDIHHESDLKKLKPYARKNLNKIKKVMEDLYDCKVDLYHSGQTGFHLMTKFKKPKSTDSVRKSFRDALKKEFKDDDIFTTGIAKKGQIRLDVTTLKNRGALRAPYSYSKTGNKKVKL